MRVLLLLTIAALGQLCTGCLDLKPSPAPEVRWLTIGESDAQAAGTPVEPTVPRIVVTSLTAAQSIDQRLVRRLSDYEVRYDDLVRWAEPPVDALSRALDVMLFQEGPFVRDPRAERRVEIELIAFEERMNPSRAGAVTLAVRATDPDGVLVIDRRFEALVRTDGEDPALVARAMTSALYSAVQQMSDLLAIR